MKISCQSCAAKYTIADEKVVGKVIKIKCKKCGATIVVNGNDPAALAQQIASEAASFDDNAQTQLIGQGAAAGLASPDEWTVSVTDDDQQTMTTDQVVAAYAQGTIQGDTYVWRDGMADWLPLAEVSELAPMLAGHGSNGHASPYASPPAQSGSFGSGGGGAYETTGAMPSPQLPVAAAMPAARKANARGSVDLFGSREEPQSAAATAANSAAHNIGERNETSVLFSLSALTAAEDAAKKPEPKRSSFQMSNDRVDDILSLGGGSAAPMLAPPPMNAPIIEAPPPPPMSVPPPSYAQGGMGMGMQNPYAMQQPQKKASPIGFIVGGIGALAAVGMLIFFLTRGSSDPAKTADTSSTAKADDTSKVAADTSKPADSAKPAESVAMADTSKPSDSS
ncbi:MAG: zinc-ribbon domain-containing protein, partial [Polyangiaceae bacterium]